MNTSKKLVEDAMEIILDRIDIDGLLLFGSYARGDFVRESDIDFVTLGEEFQRKIFKDTNPEIEVWTHPKEIYQRIINRSITNPFNESLFLGILQECQLIIEDADSIFNSAKNISVRWTWSNEVIEKLNTELERTQSLVSSVDVSDAVQKHIKQRVALYRWNIERAKRGLPLLRRLKDIFRKDPDSGIGSIIKDSKPKQRREVQALFVDIVNSVFAGSDRQLFTEIKDTIKAFDASRFDEWILSMADSLIFLAAMGIKNRGHILD